MNGFPVAGNKLARVTTGFPTPGYEKVTNGGNKVVTGRNVTRKSDGMNTATTMSAMAGNFGTAR